MIKWKAKRLDLFIDMSLSLLCLVALNLSVLYFTYLSEEIIFDRLFVVCCFLLLEIALTASFLFSRVVEVSSQSVIIVSFIKGKQTIELMKIDSLYSVASVFFILKYGDRSVLLLNSQNGAALLREALSKINMDRHKLKR